MRMRARMYLYGSEKMHPFSLVCFLRALLVDGLGRLSLRSGMCAGLIRVMESL